MKLDFLVDGGSDVTIISSQTWDQLQLKIPLKAHDRELTDVGGQVLQCKGYTDLKIKIKNREFLHKVLVLETPVLGILGADFLQMYGGIINYGQNTLTLGRLKVKLHTNEREICCRVALSNTVTIPPKSELITDGTLTTPFLGHGLVETSKGFLEKDPEILVARALIAPQNYRIPLRLINLSDEAKIVTSTTKVGKICKVTEVLDDPLGKDEALDPLLQELYERSIEGLSGEQAEKVKQLLMQNHSAFMKKDGRLGRTKVVTHQIDTGNARPIKQRPYRIPFHKRQEVQRQIDSMLEEGLISPSKSPWSSPIILVAKKEPGEFRLCVDYRKVNKCNTRQDAYSLPLINESLESMAGAVYFSNLDLCQGYHQVEVDPKDREITAFDPGFGGIYEYNVLPFGLNTAPSTFQRLMELVLAGLHWKTVLIYLDDILIFASSFEQHVQRLGEVFERIISAGLKLKPSKCNLFRRKINFLGHVVSEEGVSCDPNKLEKVKNWPNPINVKQVKQFLGLASYYRKYVPDFSTIANPLNVLTRKYVRFHWGKEEQTAFDKLKYELCNSIVLSYPDFSQSFILDCDSSNYAVGAVLSQKIGDQEKVIAYYSVSHAPPERNYSTTRKELLAVIKSIKHFKPYLYGRKFKVRTDHGSLRWLYNFKQPEGQVARWIEYLSNFEFEIEHRPGRQHGNADALSRYPIQKVNVVQIQGISREEIRQSQQSDPVIAQLIKLKEQHTEKPPVNIVKGLTPKVKGYVQQWEQLIVEDQILFRKWHILANQVETKLFLAPESMYSNILHTAHDLPSSGHLGIKKTLDRVRTNFYWLGLKNSVTEWVKGCDLCQKKKNPSRKARAPLVQDPIMVPMEKIAMDFLGPLVETDQHNKYILVVTDYFTKYTEAYPTKNMEAKTVARILVDQFIVRYGVPRVIHTDQAKNFESKLIQEVCSLLGIHKTRTSGYHAQSNGEAERFNSTVTKMLTAYVNEKQTDWDLHLNLVLMAYRSSVHETTQCTPNRLMFGREIQIPLNLMYPLPVVSCTTHTHFVQDIEKNASFAFDYARSNISKNQRRMQVNYDRKVYGKPYEVQDKVLLFTPRYKVGTSPKLSRFWDGPYQVVEVLSAANYKIAPVTNLSKLQVVHFNRLKLYNGPNPVCNQNVEFLDESSETLSETESDLDGSEINENYEVFDEISGQQVLPYRETSPSVLGPSTFGRRRKKPAWQKDYEMG